MSSIEHFIFVWLAIWMVLKLTGVFSFTEKVWLYHQAKKSAEKFARYLLNSGSESELIALLKEQRSILRTETVEFVITRLNEMADEKRQAAKTKEISMRGPAN